MWLFQIYIARNLAPEQTRENLRIQTLATDCRDDSLLTPEQRQERAKLRAFIPEQGVLKIPGVTVYEDPFPPTLSDIIRGKTGWIKRLLIRSPPPPPYAMEFDEKVWTFEVQLARRSQIDQMFEWMKGVRAWAQRRGGHIERFMQSHVVSIVMEDYQDIPSLDRVVDEVDIGKTKF